MIHLQDTVQYLKNELPQNIGYFFLTLALLYVAKLARDAFTVGIDDDNEITEKDNVAFGIYTAGYYIGVGLFLVGVLLGEEEGFLTSCIALLQYGLTGIVLMGFSYALTDWLYFKGAKSMDLLLQRNKSVALLIAGRFIYTGLNILTAIQGEGSWFLTFVYFILGEIGCFIGFKVYTWITPYDDIAEIIKGREAVGINCAGFILAMGILILNALWGNFLGFDLLLFHFATLFLGGILLLLLFRSIGGRLLFPKSTLVKEIHVDNNIGAAAIMSSVYLVVATIIVLSF